MVGIKPKLHRFIQSKMTEIKNLTFFCGFA